MKRDTSRTTVNFSIPPSGDLDLPWVEGDAQGGETSPPQEVRRPTGAGRYEDRGEIARGGMGAIHAKYDQTLGRVVASKSLREGQRGRRQSVRFIEEAQITGQLEHPNVVPVYDMTTCADSGTVSFTMKLVTGRTLDDLIDELHASGQDRPAQLERIVRVLLAVCDAVSFAHSRGVIHCDLKPMNIMVGEHGQVYVMDWGIAVVAGGRPSEQGHEQGHEPIGPPPLRGRRGIAGTFCYMAPEQARGELDEIDERTDVFSLGASLYQVLAGFPPYHGAVGNDLLERSKRAAVTPLAVLALSSGSPVGLCEIAMRALACNPADRFQSVAALRSELENFLRSGGWFATRVFRSGQTIVNEGDVGDMAFVIDRGNCDVFRGHGTERVLLRRLGPGDVFGETAMVMTAPRTATVLAVGDVVVKVITPDAFEQELKRHSWMSSLVRQITQRFLDVEAKLRDGEERGSDAGGEFS